HSALPTVPHSPWGGRSCFPRRAAQKAKQQRKSLVVLPRGELCYSAQRKRGDHGQSEGSLHAPAVRACAEDSRWLVPGGILDGHRASQPHGVSTWCEGERSLGVPAHGKGKRRGFNASTAAAHRGKRRGRLRQC